MRLCEAGVFISLSLQVQDGSKAAQGLALASNALDAAKPVVAEAEEASKAADAARSEMRDVSRFSYTLRFLLQLFLGPFCRTATNTFHPRGCTAYVRVCKVCGN